MEEIQKMQTHEWKVESDNKQKIYLCDILNMGSTGVAGLSVTQFNETGVVTISHWDYRNPEENYNEHVVISQDGKVSATHSKKPASEKYAGPIFPGTPNIKGYESQLKTIRDEKLQERLSLFYGNI